MQTIHMIGIKGSGMSALACILHDNGYKVSGSDIEETIFTEDSLRARNIPIFTFSPENIKEDQLIIAGNAFPDTHEEVAEALHKAETFYRYHEFLGEWVDKHISVAISGTHGKTSTTGMLSCVFDDVYKTSYLIGDGTGKGTPESTHFIFEACEYRRHFLAYRPSYAVITNVDFDHPDYFSSLEDVKEAFTSFASGVKKGLIVCGDNVHAKSIHADVPIYTYGLSEGNKLQAQNIRTDAGSTTFELWYLGEFLQEMVIPLVGTHHIQNTLAVLMVALLESLPLDIAQASLMVYKGVKRRFQTLLNNEYVVIDDYAHHPTEISATLETARLTYPSKSIVAVFQPHTYTRTGKFLQEFADSLRGADKVYLCSIFGSAREKRGELAIEDLQKLIPLSEIIEEENVEVLLKEKNAVLLFMGAGDIQKYERQFLALQ
ncbi:UDP-N-acetylmuramate--L-alanine ligase [Priestia megaterium]|nr:UDP-N-acetylmuramate--L-alanine ligase [Priestia megaterium]